MTDQRSESSPPPDDVPTEAEDDRDEFEPGTVVGGRYRIISSIGRGGMGRVLRAEHQMTGGAVALKVLKRGRLVGSEHHRRFELEARNAAVLQHPNTVRIYDFGLDEAWDPPLPYLVMEFLPGRPLADLIASSAGLPWRRAVHITEQVLKALWEAHEHPRHIIHRDIKASNILILNQRGNPDFVKVVDFGIARALSIESAEAKEAMGSPPTMAPEQWYGGALGPHTDLYSLGCTVYEMLAGRTPFMSDSLNELARMHISQPPDPLGDLVTDDTPPALCEWVESCLRKRAHWRPPSAREALGRLETISIESRHTPLAPRRTPTSVSAEALESTLYSSPTIGEVPLTRAPQEPAPRDDSVPSSVVLVPGAPTNLVPQYSYFVGRRRELDELTQRFLEGSPVVTIHGPAGTGKTRLAREWAISQLDHLPGGVWFCDLTEARTLDQLVVGVGAALSLHLTDADPLDQLTQALVHRGSTMVILDNVEQVLEPVCELLGRWLRDVPGGRFLITSRQRLAIDGEVVVALEPLLVPDGSARLSMQVLRGNPAVELFVDRARAMQPAFSLTAENASDVAELVRQLDGLPLAIELAAARVRFLSPGKLLERLASRFDVLRRSGEGPDRQATLAAAIEWSWQLLEPHERQALCQCATFHGGFDFEAAEAVIEVDDPAERDRVLDVVESLCDKSLLRVGAQSGDEPRFSMYRSIQAFAWSKLNDPAALSARDGTPLTGRDAVRAASRRHAAHYARLGSPERVEALGRDPAALQRLVRESENLWAAWQHGLADRDARPYAVVAFTAIAELALRRGPHAPALQAGPPLAACTDLAGLARARILIRVAAVAIRAGRLDDADEALAEAETLLGADPDPELVVDLRNERAVSRFLAGDIAEAVRLAEGSLQLAEQAQARRGQMRAQAVLGAAVRIQGDMARCRALFEEGLSIAQQLGDVADEARFHVNLGAVHVEMDAFAAARTYFESALRLARLMGDRRTERWSHMNAAVMARSQGDPRDGRKRLARALAMARQDGDRRLIVFCQVNRMLLDLDQGRHVRVRSDLDDQLTTARATRQPRLEALMLQVATRYAVDVGDRAAAGQFGRRFQELNEELGDPLMQVTANALLGRLALLDGDAAAADALLSRALDTALKGAIGLGEGEVLGYLSQVRLKQGRLDEARGLADRSVDRLRRIGAAFELGVALCQLGLVAVATRDDGAAEAALTEVSALGVKLGVAPPSQLAALSNELGQALS